MLWRKFARVAMMRSKRLGCACLEELEAGTRVHIDLGFSKGVGKLDLVFCGNRDSKEDPSV